MTGNGLQNDATSLTERPNATQSVEDVRCIHAERGNAAIGRFQADDAAKRSRLANGTAGVRPAAAMCPATAAAEPPTNRQNTRWVNGIFVDQTLNILLNRPWQIHQVCLAQDSGSSCPHSRYRCCFIRRLHTNKMFDAAVAVNRALQINTIATDTSEQRQ